jgi:acyl dehydratase
MTATLAGARCWALGDQLDPLPVGRITRTTLALFAGGSGDHNPIHVDFDVARAAGLDDVFAQGMLGMAHLGRLLTAHFPQHQLRRFTTRFTAITPVNAEPTCFGEVVALDDGEITLDLRVELTDGTQTLAGTAILSLKGNLL